MILTSPERRLGWPPLSIWMALSGNYVIFYFNMMRTVWICIQGLIFHTHWLPSRPSGCTRDRLIRVRGPEFRKAVCKAQGFICLESTIAAGSLVL